MNYSTTAVIFTQRCKAILSTPALWKATADRLVEVAKFYGFDGWLVNVENAIEVRLTCELFSVFLCQSAAMLT